MLARSGAGHTTATARAERLVIEDGVSFREAHRLVGRALTDGAGFEQDADDGLDPAAVARAARFGGGPGAPSTLDDLRLRRAAGVADQAERLRRWRRADGALDAAVAGLARPHPVLAEAGRTG